MKKHNVVMKNNVLYCKECITIYDGNNFVTHKVPCSGKKHKIKCGKIDDIVTLYCKKCFIVIVISNYESHTTIVFPSEIKTDSNNDVNTLDLKLDECINRANINLDDPPYEGDSFPKNTTKDQLDFELDEYMSKDPRKILQILYLIISK